MSEGYSGADEEPVYRPAPAPKKMKAEAPARATMLDALFGGRQARSSSAPWCWRCSVPLRGRK